MKRLRRLLLVGLLGVLVIGALGAAILHNWLDGPLGDGVGQVRLTIERGLGPKGICALLAEEGVLRSPDHFYWYVRARDAGPSLQAGTFVLRKDMRPEELLAVLQHARAQTLRMTIPEGFRATQIAARFEVNGFFSASDFMALFEDEELRERYGIASPTLEGYLYPDTYEFPVAIDAREAADRLLKRWHQVWNDGLAVQAETQGHSAQWVVTLASIVEKETAKASERPQIAGVFLRRLDQGWKLETDPTVIYGIENYDGNIRRRDLKNPHAWNTYQHKGLPPTPISSPGRAAMQAVLNPADGDTMFFVSKNDGSGSHDFSVTYKQHAAKVRKYLLR